MACAIVVMPAARQQIIAACDWWRANRPVAPTLFEHELTLLPERPNLRSAASDQAWNVFRVLGVELDPPYVHQRRKDVSRKDAIRTTSAAT